MLYKRIDDYNTFRKIQFEKKCYIIKSTTPSEFELERTAVTTSFAKDESFQASILIGMFKLEISLLGTDLQQIDKLVEQYSHEIKPVIKTDEDRRIYEMLSSSDFPKGRTTEEYWKYHDIWLSLNLSRESVYRNAIGYLKSISQNVANKESLHKLLAKYEGETTYIPGIDSDV